MKKLLLGLIMVCATILLSGCNKDSSNNSLIIGTWFNSHINGGTTECFDKNGSWSHKDDYYTMYGSYSYNSMSRVLTIHKKPSANNSEGVLTYYVLSLTSTTLSYTDGGEVIHNFERIN